MLCLLGSCKSGGNSWFGAVLVVGVLALLGVKLAQLRPAETPAAVTNAGLTLDAALDRSEAEGKPVLAFATAEWCGPCQSLKRNALKDPGVQALIESRTIAVTLEETTAQGARDIGKLPVDGFPTLMLIQNGMVQSKIVGAQSTSAITAWLESNTTAPAVTESDPASAASDG